MERIGSLVVAPTAERTAEPGRFSAALERAGAHVASGVAGTVALAAPFLPGGMVLAGALRAAAGPTPFPFGAASPAPGGGLAGAGGGPGDVLEATRALQQEAQTFNVQYLQLQEGMQRESREFTAVSNVMRVKHDSAKAAIGNIH